MRSTPRSSSSCWRSQARVEAVEAVEERGEAAGPVGVTEVHGVDAVLGELRRPPLGAFLHQGQPRGVDQLHVGVERAEAGDGLPVRVAEPEAGEQVGRGLPHRLDHRSGGGDVLEVEREVVVPTARRRGARPGSGCGPGARERRWSRSFLRRKRPPLTPSWSSTGTPSEVSQTSLSRPVAPRRRASRKASKVFSGAWARAPRWAKATGGTSRDGNRCCTARIMAAAHRRPAARPATVDGGDLPRLGPCSTSVAAS